MMIFHRGYDYFPEKSVKSAQEVTITLLTYHVDLYVHATYCGTLSMAHGIHIQIHRSGMGTATSLSLCRIQTLFPREQRFGRKQSWPNFKYPLPYAWRTEKNHEEARLGLLASQLRFQLNTS